MTVKKYKIYCETESKYVSGWSETEPITCFNNNTHTIDSNLTTITDFNIDNVKIVQTTPEKTNYFYVHSIYETINHSETKVVPIIQNIEYYLYSVKLLLNKNHLGDLFSVYINKDTLIGNITQSSSGQIITVSQTVIDNSVIGFYVFFNNDYHRIIDKSTNTLTLENSVTVNPGDAVLMTYFMIYKKNLGMESEILGSTVFNAKFISKNYTAGFIYENKSNSTKYILIDIETTF